MIGKLITSISHSDGAISGKTTNSQSLTGGISASAEVLGSIASGLSLFGDVTDRSSVQGSISNNSTVVGIIAMAHVTQGEAYEGDYDVTPKVDKQLLKTKHKYMTDDVRILAIPYFEVGNTTGGNTVYIAEKIEM